ncbi:hypothetical protein AeNC1_017258, partial [Aphanomyces euteiches]
TVLSVLGHEISASAANKAKLHLVKNVYGAIDEAFEKLESYFEIVVKKNPGSIAKVQNCHGVVSTSCRFGRNTFLKDLMNSNGVLLVATTKHPNNHLLVLGIAIVPVENYDNWQWFMRHLQTAGILKGDVVILSDRDKGLKKACMNVCPELSHRFCLRHIVANIRSAKDMSLTPDEERLVYRLATRSCRESFDNVSHKLLSTNPKAFKFLMNEETLPRENWASYAFSSPTFGNVTSNLGESANQWLGKDLRSSNVLELHFLYLKHLVENIVDRRNLSSKIPDDGLTPYHQKRFDDLNSKAKLVKILPSTPGKEYLTFYDDPAATSGHKWRNVDITSREFDCRDWFAANTNPLELYSKCYSTTNFKAICTTYINAPVPHNLLASSNCKAPSSLLQTEKNLSRGPKSKKCKPSRGMDVGSSQRSSK